MIRNSLRDIRNTVFDQRSLPNSIKSCLPFVFVWKTGTGASERFVMVLVPSGLKKNGVASP